MKTALASMGSVGTALLAHVPCCGLNVAMVAGSAGFGAGFFSMLAPYRAWFLGFSVIMAVVAVWLAFRPHKACGHEDCHHNESRQRKWRQGLAIASCALVAAGFFVPVAGSHHGHNHETGVVLND